MPITLVDPEGLPKADLYSQVSVATGSKLVFIAGQIARDADSRRVGEDDLAAQVEQCYFNINTALAEVGGSFSDVARLSVYLVDWSEDKLPVFGRGPRPSCKEARADHRAAAHGYRRFGSR